MTLGLRDVILCDRTGAIYEGREKLNPSKEAIAKVTNREMTKGTLADAVKGSDIFIGVSAPGVLTTQMIKTMNTDRLFLQWLILLLKLCLTRLRQQALKL